MFDREFTRIKRRSNQLVIRSVRYHVYRLIRTLCEVNDDLLNITLRELQIRGQKYTCELTDCFVSDKFNNFLVQRLNDLSI
jgi:hypothetical protein